MRFERVEILSKITCKECERVFDLTVKEQADEWSNGHDCEA